MKPEDKRKHKRFPVVKDLAEPVTLHLVNGPIREIPAILTNLSAGGMAMVVFAHLSKDSKFKMVLNIPGLEGVEVQGRVAWMDVKGDTTLAGVSFQALSHENFKKINQLAEAYQDCELKISFGLKDVCFRGCFYWPLCNKPLKLKN